MAQEPATAMPMNGILLEHILKQARSDAAFRDRLLKTPEATLESVHIRPDKEWVRFFEQLTISNFESVIQNKIDSEPTGEAEIEDGYSTDNHPPVTGAGTHGPGDGPYD